MSTRSGSRRQPRGAAAVETAVLMIILVPLIMYQLFLSDLLAYRLDQDEAVYSSTWDFFSYDYRHNDKAKMKGEADVDTPSADDLVSWTSLNVRKTYFDHSSAYNNYGDSSADANDNTHHQALAAHECWLANKTGDQSLGRGEQVTCWTVGQPGVPDPIFGFMPQGSMYACRARLGVQNYFIPSKFLNFGKVAMTPDVGSSGQMKHWTPGSDVHGNAPGDPYMFPESSFAVLHDPWAFNYVRSDAVTSGKYPRDRSSNHVTIDPQKHPLNLLTDFDEMSRWMMVPFGLYTSAYLLPGRPPYRFLQQMQSDKFGKMALGILEPAGVGGDILSTAPVAWKKAKDNNFGGQYASGWRDSRASGLSGPDLYMRRQTNQW